MKPRAAFVLLTLALSVATTSPAAQEPSGATGLANRPDPQDTPTRVAIGVQLLDVAKIDDVE